jgi:serine protease Do
VLDQLVGGGKVVRGYLGVQISEVSPELARKFQVEPGAGALVGEVVEGGPADQAGILAGDVIVKVGTTVVTEPRQLRLHVAGMAPGSEALIEVMRGGKAEQIRLTVGELPGSVTVAAAGGDQGGRIGVVLQDLTPQQRQQAEIPSRVQGALVVQVEPGSRAERAGLRQGMVVSEVERRPVADASAAVQQLRLAKGEVLLRVWAEGSNRWLVVPE